MIPGVIIKASIASINGARGVFGGGAQGAVSPSAGVLGGRAAEENF